MASRGIPSRALGNMAKDGLAGAVTGTEIKSGVEFLINLSTVAGTATYYPYYKNCPRRLEVIDLFAVLTAAGGAGDTLQLKDASDNAITDAIDCNKSSTAVVRMANIDGTYNVIPKGGTLKVVTASDATVDVYIRCMWLAP